MKLLLERLPARHKAGGASPQPPSSWLRIVRRWILTPLNGQGGFGATIQTMATRLAIFGLNILAGVITARTMGPDGRGLLAALLTWPQLIAYLSTCGLTNSLLYHVKAQTRDEGGLFAAALVLVFGAGMIACLIGAAIMPWLLPHNEAGELLAARLMMMAAPLVLLALAVQTSAEAAADFPGANALRGVSTGGTFAFVAICALTGRLTPVNAALCYLLPQAPMTLWLFRRLSAYYRPTLRGFWSSSVQLMRYGLRCYPMDMLNTALTYAGQAFVVTLLPPAEVGYFVVSLGVARLLEIVYASAGTILLPATSGRPQSEVAAQTFRTARINLLVTGVVAIALIAILPLILPKIYGEGFIEAVTTSRLLMVEGTISGTVWVLMQAFSALGRPESSILLQAIGLVLLLSGLLAVVPTYGILGAATVLLMVSTCKLSLTLGFCRVLLGTSPSQLSPKIADLQYIKTALLRQI